MYVCIYDSMYVSLYLYLYLSFSHVQHSISPFLPYPSQAVEVVKLIRERCSKGFKRVQESVRRATMDSKVSFALILRPVLISALFNILFVHHFLYSVVYFFVLRTAAHPFAA